MTKLKEKISMITDAIEDKKGNDIEVLDISEHSTIADYFIIASGNSSTQAQSIADAVEEKMQKEAGYEEIRKEGYRSGRWILLDLNDIIVHIFHKEEREYYNLERLWKEGPKED